MNLVPFDILILTVITATSILSLRRGAIYVSVHFISFILKISVAIYLYPYINVFILGYTKNKLIVSILSVLVSYAIPSVVLSFIVSRILLVLKVVRFGLIDRSLGFILGLIKGIVFSLIIFTGLKLFTNHGYYEGKNINDLLTDVSGNDYAKRLGSSKAIPYLEDYLNKTAYYLPENILQYKLPESENKTEDKSKDENIPEFLIEEANRQLKNQIKTLYPKDKQ